MFSVGQKVVCVDDGLQPCGAGAPVKRGLVYTVSALCGRSGSTNCIQLREINHPGLFARRFRPLTERKTSIEVFQRMLTPNKETADV